MEACLRSFRKWREKKERELNGEDEPAEKKKVAKVARNRMIDKELRCRNCRYGLVLCKS